MPWIIKRTAHARPASARLQPRVRAGILPRFVRYIRSRGGGATGSMRRRSGC